jgi:hypothetical protein
MSEEYVTTIDSDDYELRDEYGLSKMTIAAKGRFEPGTLVRGINDDMRPEYDFSGGVRGKHYKVLREEGCIIRIYNDDGTVTERHVAGERTVILELDVADTEHP